MKPIRLKYFYVKLFFACICLLAFSPICKAQYFQLGHRQKKELIPFKFIKNLIIVSVKINDRGPYNFVLDTGVGLVLITDYTLADSLHLKNLRNIKIVGLGGNEDLEAFISPPLSLSVGSARAEYIPSAILKKDAFNLSEYVGMPVHGLLGYEFFSSFITRISYINQSMVIYPYHSVYIPRKGYKIPITIEERKPYLESDLTLSTGEHIKAKLIIDSGAGHPLSLESNSGIPFPIPDVNIAGNLGVGLSGPIRGYFGRIPSIKLGKYELKEVITAFPNYNDVGAKITISGRHGNLGNQILKRFEVVFDYFRGSLYLKPSGYFKEKFEHDMSGLEFITPGPDYNRLFVSRVAPDSPGEWEGIEAGDEIISINLKPVSEYTPSEIDDLFKSGNEKNYLLSILPKDSQKTRKVIFTLKRRI